MRLEKRETYHDGDWFLVRLLSVVDEVVRLRKEQECIKVEEGKEGSVVPSMIDFAVDLFFIVLFL